LSTLRIERDQLGILPYVFFAINGFVMGALVERRVRHVWPALDKIAVLQLPMVSPLIFGFGLTTLFEISWNGQGRNTLLDLTILVDVGMVIGLLMGLALRAIQPSVTWAQVLQLILRWGACLGLEGSLIGILLVVYVTFSDPDLIFPTAIMMVLPIVLVHCTTVQITMYVAGVSPRQAKRIFNYWVIGLIASPLWYFFYRDLSFSYWNIREDYAMMDLTSIFTPGLVSGVIVGYLMVREITHSTAKHKKQYDAY
jgi:hypothetical protein